MSETVSQRDALNEKPEAVQVRVHGPIGAPTLVYLPGLHGDWTLLTGFRCAVENRVRLVEITYPRTLDWSLAIYASEIVTRLKKERIFDGWLLGESFGSQVVWEILKQGEFKAQGAILAGGFGRHPLPWAAALAARLSGRLTYFVLRQCLATYKRTARIRFGRSAESRAALEKFVRRRTWRDFRAARHRLRLVAEADPRLTIQAVRIPVYLLTGLLDPIVPWLPARGALNRQCTTLAGERVIWRADHNVLGTAPQAAAEQIFEWMARPPANVRVAWDE